MGSLNLFCRSEPYTNKVERHLVTVEALESSGGNQVTRKSNKLLSKVSHYAHIISRLFFYCYRKRGLKQE